MIISVPIGYASGITDTNNTFLSLSDAEAIDISLAQDVLHVAPCHHHISEFFRLSPNGTLHVRFVPQGTTMAQMLDLTGNHAMSILNYAAGKVRQLAVALNPAVGYAPVIVDGLDTDTVAAVNKGRELAAAAEEQGMPLVILVEGRGFSGVPGTVKDLTTMAGGDVGVVILQEPTTRATNAFNGYGAVGTVLGLLSSAGVHENIGWVQKFNIQSASLYVNAGFTSDQVESQLTAAGLSTLLAKGYLFARSIPNYAGTYIADDPTCIVASHDYSRLRYCRASQKAVRQVRQVIQPFVNSPIYLTTDGRLTAGTVAVLENTAASELEAMKKAGEISDYDANVATDQDVLSTNTIEMGVAIIPVGCASWINVTLRFTTSIV